MKRKIFIGIAVIIFVLGLNFIFKPHSSKINFYAGNIEALASEEFDASVPCFVDVVEAGEDDDLYVVLRKCSPCTEKNLVSANTSGRCWVK